MLVFLPLIVPKLLKPHRVITNCVDLRSSGSHGELQSQLACPPPQLALCSWTHALVLGIVPPTPPRAPVQQPCLSRRNCFHCCDEIQRLSACHIHTDRDVSTAHVEQAASSPSTPPGHSVLTLPVTSADPADHSVFLNVATPASGASLFCSSS